MHFYPVCGVPVMFSSQCLQSTPTILLRLGSTRVGAKIELALIEIVLTHQCFRVTYHYLHYFERDFLHLYGSLAHISSILPVY